MTKENPTLKELLTIGEWYKEQLLNQRREIDNVINELNQLLCVKDCMELNLPLKTLESTRERLECVLSGRIHKERKDVIDIS